MKNPGNSILKGALFLLAIALLAFLYAFGAYQLRGEAVIEISTGEEGTFELEEPDRLVLVDTNTGLGSSPGTIEVDGGVRLYGPDGELCELDPDGYGQRSYHFGEYDLKEAGTYRFVLDEIQDDRVRSTGALKTRDTLPGLVLAVVSGVACFLLAILFAILGALALLFSAQKEVPQP